MVVAVVMVRSVKFLNDSNTSRVEILNRLAWIDIPDDYENVVYAALCYERFRPCK